jgi:hypothetical protein
MRRACLAASACAVLGVGAQEATVGGTNTVRWERYDTRGDATNTPYPISARTGYDEFALTFDWRASAYDRWRALVNGVVNDSPYRSFDRGVVPERIAVSRENGEAAVPYRAEAGDFYAFTSVRTQQRPLKGLSLELQPDTAFLRQSILAFAGAFQPSWRDFSWRDDNATGISWLGEGRAGRLGANALRTERTLNDRRIRQDVASLMGEAAFTLGPTRWRADGEVAALRGDRLDGSGERAHDTGAFAQLSGSELSNTLTWRLRGERYGRDYQPSGAAVTADRRSEEAHLGWAAPLGLTLRLRGQRFRDGVEAGNALETRVAGASVSGPLGSTGASLSADAFRQRLERDDGSVHQDTNNANASVAIPMAGGLTQLGAVWQDVDDRLLADGDRRTRQLTASHTRTLTLAGWQGVISPGIAWRRLDGSALATRELQPTLALQLSREAHRFALNFARLSQDPAAASLPDVATINASLEYRFRFGRHEIGVDYVAYDRRPSPGESTRAYRAGVQWTMYLDRVVARAATPAAAVVPIPASFSRDASIVAAIPIGADLDAVLTSLADAGFPRPTRQPGLVIYEAMLLADVGGRQRLAIAHDAGRVERVALLVSLAESPAPGDAARTWERTMSSLISRFGRPAAAYDEGTFGAGYANDVMMGRLLRAAEWALSDGVLRAGIPRRLDGVARIEIVHARALPSPREGWGVAIP